MPTRPPRHLGMDAVVSVLAHDWRDDVKFEVYSTGPSGYVPHRATGIKATHGPTGLVAIADCARSQHTNRRIALDMIEGGLTNRWAVPK